MTIEAADTDLVRAYAVRGSESAFRALVERHVHLVHATALRQVGDSGLAEEITQTVFMALARKAPRLAGVQTLAGWLHRTTILEAKARIRAELRRRRRERAAAELVTIEREGVDFTEALLPLLDEALLRLRECDRLALVLRFFEDRSLREVGAALGVDEEAARKRVSRALDRLTAHFRQRGFAVPSIGLGPVLLAGAVQAAPSGLAASVVQAGLATGGATSGLNLLWIHLMTLSKTQTVALCALVATVPLVWQRQALSALEREGALIAADMEASQRNVLELEAEVRRTRENLLRAQADTLNANNRLTALTAQLEGRAPRPVYGWDDASLFVRVPKRFLDETEVTAVANRHGRLSEEIIEVLQLTDAEVIETQAAVDRFLAAYHAEHRRHMRQVNPTEAELQGRDPEETRVFELPDLGERFEELRDAFFEELELKLGPDRYAYFRDRLFWWMSLPDESASVAGRAVLDHGHRIRFYQPEPGSTRLAWGVQGLDDPRASSGAMELDDIPDLFLPHLQDWIVLARSRPPKEPGTAP
jgi:RNA polymerase sigma factor (sigma-70 family)